jgi:hypothetical protein
MRHLTIGEQFFTEDRSVFPIVVNQRIPPPLPQCPGRESNRGRYWQALHANIYLLHRAYPHLAMPHQQEVQRSKKQAVYPITETQDTIHLKAAQEH